MTPDEAATILGITTRTLRNYLAAGAPGVSRNGGGKTVVHDIDALRGWMTANVVTGPGSNGGKRAGAGRKAGADTGAPPEEPTAAETKRKILALELAEMEREAAKARGELIPADEAVEKWGAACAAAAAVLETLPARAAGRAMGALGLNASQTTALRLLVEEEVRAVRVKLAEGTS